MTDRQTDNSMLTGRWKQVRSPIDFLPYNVIIKIWRKKMYIKEVKGVRNKNVLQV